MPPRPLPGDSALELEAELRDSLNAADRAAKEVGSKIIMIGILPTIMPEHYEGEWMSRNNRYTALNDSIFVARGEDIYLDIEGPTGERVATYCDSIAPESACTSVQLHLQVAPSEFAAHWNAAQALSAPQVALGANSPYFFGKRLRAETRIELFKQATDTRPLELKNQGVRPRVFFGERWITSIFDLFEENVRYFPTLLAETTDEDPMAVLEAGSRPSCSELRLHNGTVYRWNRPIYDIVDGPPHLRVENRVLPAGPTVVDVLANAAFYYGALRMLAHEDRPVWTKMSFAAGEENFRRAARDGIDARLYWPGFGEVSADELVLRHLLPIAHEGLRQWGVSGCRARALPRRHRGPLQDRRQRRRVAGRDGRSVRGRRLRPARGAAPDARAVHRAHALQRAGAHLADALTPRVRWGACSSTTRAARSRPTPTGCSAAGVRSSPGSPTRPATSCR